MQTNKSKDMMWEVATSIYTANGRLQNLDNISAEFKKIMSSANDIAKSYNEDKYKEAQEIYITK